MTYDNNKIMTLISRADGCVKIPTNSDRKVPRELDQNDFGESTLIEHFFGWIK